MSKVICDICGTVYQDTAESCPICGYSQISGFDGLKEELLEDETLITRNKAGRFAESNVKKKHKEIFDYDEVNADEDEEPEESYEEDEDYEESTKSNTVVVVILVIVIMLLLAAAGFIFLRFFLPNISGRDDTLAQPVMTEPVQTETEETTEPTIPCQSIALTGGMAELEKEGQYWLLNVKVVPEDTTDELTFTSGDESVVTVTADGRITAVGEGETTVYIACGKQQINCPVVVKFVEETEPSTEATGETMTEETVSAETQTQETEIRDVELKLKEYDITLSVGYGYQLELDCDLDPSQVLWGVEHSYIATVDENGFVKAVGYGTTAVIVKYGDQEVQCIIRCK